MNSPFVQQVIGVFVRAALVWFAAWVASHGGPALSEGDISHAVSVIVPLVAALAWSIWSKYRGRQKLLTALAAPHPMSEAQALDDVRDGRIPTPSVNTPVHEVPRA
jgi:hypothetical protein